MTQLELGQWYPKNHHSLQAWLASIPRTTPPACAVFDWDNTCVFNDIGDAAFAYQSATLALCCTPEELQGLLPDRVLDQTHVDGVAFAPLAADIVYAYKTLWPGMQHDAAWVARYRAYSRNESPCDKLPAPYPSIPPIAQLASTEPIGAAYHDFRAKLAAYYQLLRHIGHGAAYQWMARLFAGTTPHGAEQLAIDAFQHAQAQTTPAYTWRSATPGQSGHTTFSMSTRIAAIPEMRQLVQTMRAYGLEIFVISASYEGLVRGIARHLKYAVDADHIFGVRLQQEGSRNTPNTRDPSIYPMPYREGKVAMIQRFLPASPIFVAGDADTDYEMLTAFTETKMRLIINCNRTGVISLLYGCAREQIETSSTNDGCITLLQGRDHTQGCFRPHQETIV